MSTDLHYWSAPGALPFTISENCPGPCAALCSSDVNSKVSQSPDPSHGPGSPPLPVHHPPPAGRPYCHDAHLHHLLPVRSSASGGDFTLHGQPDGAMAVAKGTGSRQLLHPLPHSSGRPAGDLFLGSEFQTDYGSQFYGDWSLTQTRGAAHPDCTIPYMQVAETHLQSSLDEGRAVRINEHMYGVLFVPQH